MSMGGLIVRQPRFGFRDVVESYDWRIEKRNNSPLWLSADYFPRELRPGEVVTAGPYRVRIVEVDFSYMAYRVVEERVFAFLVPPLYRIRWHLGRALARVIMTAAVWGLASWERNAIPSWRNVHALAWLARKVGR